MKYKVIRIPYLGYHTRAYAVGDFKNATPLIVLHGGPGGCVERYEPFEKFAEHGIPVIFYDQLGCGYSRVPKNTIDWNFDIFLNELENLIKTLGLKKFYILGHSWGGMLALEWVSKHKHEGLEKLILFSTLPSTKIWNEEHLKMIKDFPEEYKTAIINEYEGKDYDPETHKLAVKHFYKTHVGKRSKDFYNFNRKKFPKTNREIYEKMWGKNELFGTGTLKDWSCEETLGNVDVPTLILNGRFDESSVGMNDLMHKNIKNSEWHILENSHHIGYVEECELTRTLILDFLLKRAERN